MFTIVSLSSKTKEQIQIEKEDSNTGDEEQGFRCDEQRASKVPLDCGAPGQEDNRRNGESEAWIDQESFWW